VSKPQTQISNIPFFDQSTKNDKNKNNQQYIFVYLQELAATCSSFNDNDLTLAAGTPV